MIGIVAAKMAAFSLLPLGGSASLDFVRHLFIRFQETRIMMVYALLGFFSIWAINLAWIFAMIAYCLSS